MKVAFFSPFPPARSGIADYSESLASELQNLVELHRFSSRDGFDPSAFDLCVYQIGNNADHVAPYETALQTPGVVVLHEANLHHLICDLTIRRQNWDAYVEEAAFDSGPDARAFALRVRNLEAGPDYDGVPMLRRLASSTRAAITHSQFVLDRFSQSGFSGPAAVIPHGAALLHPDRVLFRYRLGVPLDTPLVGIFGHLKPYKRIHESLRAFRRLRRELPDAKLLLAGEPHPDLHLESTLAALGLDRHVLRPGALNLEDFNGAIGACDVILNLRYPTVGETSGTLMRAFGLARPVLVSDVGAFSELPAGTCLKIPVGGPEEDLLFEYLLLLLTAPDHAATLGRHAQSWVAHECQWPLAAQRYAAFFDQILTGSRPPRPVSAPTPPPPPEPAPAFDLTQYLRSWPAESDDSAAYREKHLERYRHTLDLTPKGGPGSKILEMGVYMQITPALSEILGYETVEGCYFGELGTESEKQIRHPNGSECRVRVRNFDAERDRFPYDDAEFNTVLCCELIEHLASDPGHLMTEIHRILKPGGHLVLSTPNATSNRALQGILLGYHPGFFTAFTHPKHPGDPRHAREYAAREVAILLQDFGFDVLRLETCEFDGPAPPELDWIDRLLERYGLPRALRGNDILGLGRKSGPIRERYPDWLYA